MNRVWKKFLRKLFEPIAAIVYTCAVVSASIWASTAISTWAGGAILGIWILFPIIGYLIRDMWRDAKREVEWENEDLMRKIKGGKIDY